MLPAINASLNALTTCLLLAGLFQIRRGNRAAHGRWMLGAVTTSSLFLVGYVVHHLRVGSVRFTGEGWVRPVYFAILGTHTVLAAALVPLVLVTLVRALRERFDRHKKIARVTLPIWLYVSVTGVVVYFMLYHAFPRA